jgi:thiol-disulfide isomerase/thioredoxin
MYKLYSIKYFILGLAFSSFSYLARGQTVPEILKFKKLAAIIAKTDDTTRVFNFFASWCMPCIKELPEFESLAQEKKHEKVKIIYVSLDFINSYQESLIPLMNKLALTQKVYLLNESDPNKWINEIDKNWSGSIPATLIVNHQKKRYKFIPNSISKATLKKYLP